MGLYIIYISGPPPPPPSPSKKDMNGILPTIKHKGGRAKEKEKEKNYNTQNIENKQKNICVRSKSSQAQGCELLTDLNFTINLPKLGHLESFAAFSFILEFLDSFELFIIIIIIKRKKKQDDDSEIKDAK